MKGSFLLIGFLCLSQLVFCQGQNKKIDSLIQVSKTKDDDTGKVKLLNNICKRLWIAGEFDRSMTFANEALSLAEKLQYKHGIAGSYNNIGIVYDQKGNYSEALTYHFASLKAGEEAGDKQDIMYSYGNIANVYTQQGKYTEAIKNYMSVQAIAKEIGNKSSMAYSFTNIGFINALQGNYTEALKSHLTALKIEEEIKDVFGISFCYRNMGDVYLQQGAYQDALKNYSISLKYAQDVGDRQSIANAIASTGEVYMAQNNYKEALKQLEAALKIEQEIGDKLGSTNILNNIGSAYSQSGNLTEALKNYLFAKDIEEELGNRNGIASTYTNLGFLYIKLNKINEARKSLEKGLAISKEMGVKSNIRDSYKGLSDLDSVTGNFEGAYKYFVLYSTMDDSLLDEKTDKEISELKIQYETDKKDQQINTQNLQLQNQTLNNTVLQTRIYYGIVTSLIVTVIIILLFYLRNRRKKKEYNNNLVSLELTALKAQLNPHFIFNALNSIKAYIDSNPKTGSDYLTRFSLLMRGVLEGSEEKEISLGEEMQLMQHYIELESLRLVNGLTYNITYDPSLNRNDIMIPPLITQPVIENAVWHGLAALDDKGVLTIHCYLLEGTLFISVTNTANNAEAPVVVKPQGRKSFGMKITRERILLLKKTNGREGTLNLERRPTETCVTISIPVGRRA